MSNTFDYTQEELRNPIGSGKLSPRAKFYQRSLYKDAVYPDNIVKPLDTWYDKNLFGRVDQKQNPILVIGSRLVEIRAGARPGMYALEFVEKAFMDLAEHMKTAYITSCISRGGNPALFNMKAHIAYTSPLVRYENYTASLYRGFNRMHRDTAARPIKDFSDYKKAFTEYLTMMCEEMPITRTSFLLSNLVSPFISGLKIGIAREDADSDIEKVDAFIGDPNYLYYVESAKKFGFIVDKNMPWILTADLFSDAMLSYLRFFLSDRSAAITKNNFFEVYFFKGYGEDIELLSSMMRRGYAELLSKRPLYAEEKIIFNRRCTNALQTKTFYRTPSSSKDVLTLKEGVDLYTLLRYQEAQGHCPPLKVLRRRSYELLRAYGRFATTYEIPQFINDSFKEFLYPPHYGQANRDLKLDKDTSSGIIDTALEVAKSIASG